MSPFKTLERFSSVDIPACNRIKSLGSHGRLNLNDSCVGGVCAVAHSHLCDRQVGGRVGSPGFAVCDENCVRTAQLTPLMPDCPRQGQEGREIIR